MERDKPGVNTCPKKFIRAITVTTSCPNYLQISRNIMTSSEMSIVCHIYGALALLFSYILNASHFEQKN
jgi:hypothetical protein